MKTISNKSKVDKVIFRPEFSAICSVGKKPFWGNIKITYYPGGEILEFCSVEEYIKTLANQSVTIEDITRIVFDECLRVLGDIPLRVIVSARTTVHAPASAEISNQWSNEK